MWSVSHQPMILFLPHPPIARLGLVTLQAAHCAKVSQGLFYPHRLIIYQVQPLGVIVAAKLQTRLSHAHTHLDQRCDGHGGYQETILFKVIFSSFSSFGNIANYHPFHLNSHISTEYRLSLRYVHPHYIGFTD